MYTHIHDDVLSALLAARFAHERYHDAHRQPRRHSSL
jgi:hypothetical protein